MRKTIRTIIIVISVVITVAVYFFITSKAYYPQLPFEGLSKMEVAKMLGQRDKEIVLLVENDSYVWYGFKGNQLEGSEALKHKKTEEEWTFIEQMGSGYIFMNRDNKKWIITSQMWTGKYVLYKVQK